VGRTKCFGDLGKIARLLDIVGDDAKTTLKIGESG